MNVLYLCDEYPPCQHGGIGTATQLLARSIAAKGHHVFVVGFYPYYRKAQIAEIDQGVNVFRYFYGSFLLLKLSKHFIVGRFINIDTQFRKYLGYLKKLISEKKIDIIESPDFVEAFRYSGPRIIEFLDFGIPFIVKLHGSYTIIGNLQKIDKNIFLKEQLLLNSSTSIIAVSNSVKDRVKNHFNVNRTIDIIYNGINLTKISREYSSPVQNTVVFVGKLTENKGVFSLIKAWCRVIEIMPTAKLYLYGKGDEESINIIHSLLKDLPNNGVELKGFVSKEDLQSVFLQVSCAVFPSYQEAFGMAPMEAMAVGCPVIFTKLTSGPELITNGVDGLLVDPDNEQEISDAIILMLTNRKRAIEMGQNGVRKIRDNFDINLIAEKHIEYYNQFL